MIRECDYCGSDTGNEWISYCGYKCAVQAEKEEEEKDIANEQ